MRESQGKKKQGRYRLEEPKWRCDSSLDPCCTNVRQVTDWEETNGSSHTSHVYFPGDLTVILKRRSTLVDIIFYTIYAKIVRKIWVVAKLKEMQKFSYGLKNGEAL